MKLNSSRNDELISSIIHFAGLLFAIIALVIMVVQAAHSGGAKKIVSASIFGASLILTYLASAVYHLVYQGTKTKNILKKIDHAAIYILIAGTYMPVCLIVLKGGWGWSFFGVAWGLALIGVTAKLSRLKIKIWLSNTVYILMGWMIAIAFWPLINSLSLKALLWLIGGGLFYTVGTIFYSLEKKYPKFYLHEIWHVFVLAGSYCHFWLILIYTLK